MIRLTYVDTTGREREYSATLAYSSETVMETLEKHGANPDTLEVYLNGNYVPQKDLDKSFGKLLKGEQRAFLTVRPRRV